MVEVNYTKLYDELTYTFVDLPNEVKKIKTHYKSEKGFKKDIANLRRHLRKKYPKMKLSIDVTYRVK